MGPLIVDARATPRGLPISQRAPSTLESRRRGHDPDPLQQASKRRRGKLHYTFGVTLSMLGLRGVFHTSLVGGAGAHAGAESAAEREAP